jgi:sugar/nucleoside kinase (ribokinase family)
MAPEPRGAVLAPRPARRFDVLGVGECSLDTWLEVEALPAPGGKAAVSDWRELPGGQVATATLAAARLGLRAAYAGVVGDDAAAERVLAPLRAARVDCSRVRVAPQARTRAAVIVVERASGERAVLGYRDARLAAQGGALASQSLDDVRLLLLDGTDFAVALPLARAARAHGVPVVLDLDTPSAQAEELLACVDFPVVSQGFAERAFGSAEKALAHLVSCGARLPVVTCGAHGALAWWEGRPLASPAFAVDAVDTTGAGDVFHGAFAWGLLQGLDVAALLRAANAAAALACTGRGAQGALPDAAQLEAFLAARRDYSSS